MAKNMKKVRMLNKRRGFHFFSPATMRFFNSKIETSLLKGNYFITSERMESTMPKKYTIRKTLPSGKIESARGFCSFHSLKEAKAEIERL